MPKLTDSEITSALTHLAAWSVENGRLHREFRFPNFSYAMGFMMTAAPSIEKVDHHPEWANVYNRVTVDLMTHDAGGITEKDVQLADLLENIAKKFL